VKLLSTLVWLLHAVSGLKFSKNKKKQAAWNEHFKEMNSDKDDRREAETLNTNTGID
jgi:hypothetical protein